MSPMILSSQVEKTCSNFGADKRFPTYSVTPQFLESSLYFLLLRLCDLQWDYLSPKYWGDSLEITDQALGPWYFH